MGLIERAPSTCRTAEGHFDSEYGRQVLFIARAMVLEGRDASDLLDLLNQRPLEAATLNVYRQAASCESVTSLVRSRNPERVFRQRPKVTLQFAMGIAWEARRESTRDASKALSLSRVAWEAAAALPQLPRRYVAQDLFGLIELATANALRRLERFGESAQAFERAYCYLSAGVCAAPVLGEYLGLWASLLLDQGKLGPAGFCLAIARELSTDPVGHGRVLVKEGNLLRLLGDPGGAEKSYMAARNLVPSDFHRFLTLNLAQVCAEQGKAREAKKHLDLFRPSSGDTPYIRAMTFLVTGLTAVALGQNSKGAQLLAEAAKRFESCQDLQGVALCYLDLCLLAARDRKWGEVARLSRSALELLALLGLEGQALAAWAIYFQSKTMKTLTVEGLQAFRRRFPALIHLSRREEPS